MEKTRLEISKSGFKLNDKDFYLASGDIHYFRIHPSDWEQRLLLMKDFGLTAIQVYMPWHLHEPQHKKFDFYGCDGELNFKEFARLADKHELKILLRPAPYICSECDKGGLPAWLNEKKKISVRCCDKDYLKFVKSYYKRLCKEFVPFLSTKGGPIIAVALDNEYGGYGNDKQYLIELRKMLEGFGVDVPFYTTDGYSNLMTVNGSLPDCLHGINYRSTDQGSKKAFELLGNLRPDFPLFAGEFWSGRSTMWDETNFARDPKDVAADYKDALEMGGFVNFYMFTGGTNFGFTSGAIFGSAFTPNPDKAKKYPKDCFYTTSYDCDALIGEDGNPTEKYFLCRDVLDEYLGKEKRPHTYERKEYQELEIELTKSAELFENIDALTSKKTESLLPMTMDEMGQSFGYILYSTDLKEGADSWTRFKLDRSVKDRANIFVDGKFKGTYMNGGDNQTIDITVKPGGVTIDLLVENMGRYSNAFNLNEEKGMLCNYIFENSKNVYYWTQRSIPMNDLSQLDYKDIEQNEIEASRPVFLKGTFNAKAGVDAYLLTEGFVHGNVWINGFNIGRYWEKGPQKTLLIPGGLLKENGNILEIFDTEYNGETRKIRCIDKHIIRTDQTL